MTEELAQPPAFLALSAGRRVRGLLLNTPTRDRMGDARDGTIAEALAPIVVST